MKKDTPSFAELVQDQQRHWSQVGDIRDERYQTVKRMLDKPYRCQHCGFQNSQGGICVKCRECRVIEIE